MELASIRRVNGYLLLVNGWETVVGKCWLFFKGCLGFKKIGIYLSFMSWDLGFKEL